MGKSLRRCLPAILLAGLVVACGSATDGDKAGNGQSSERSEEEQTPKETTSQRKARHKAEEYVAVSAHSRTGLIEKLESEKFSNEDAAYAVDALGLDWRDQAAQKAKELLADSSHSRDALKDQLKSEGFTDDEAEYGVSQFYE